MPIKIVKMTKINDPKIIIRFGFVFSKTGNTNSLAFSISNPFCRSLLYSCLLMILAIKTPETEISGTTKKNKDKLDYMRLPFLNHSFQKNLKKQLNL